MTATTFLDLGLNSLHSLLSRTFLRFALTP